MAKPSKSVPLVTFILWEIFMRFHEVWLVLSVMISLETELVGSASSFISAVILTLCHNYKHY